MQLPPHFAGDHLEPPLGVLKICCLNLMYLLVARPGDCPLCNSILFTFVCSFEDSVRPF